MSKAPVSIVIPVYKAELSTNERNALKQIVNVLGAHQISIATFKELDIDNYISILSGCKLNVEYFSRSFFSSIAGYNQLLLSPLFYRAYYRSNYILICQLDAWVFRDELRFWCEAGYDYIGAPWYDGYALAEAGSSFIGVGNGGFSLRNVASHLKVLRNFAFVYPYSELQMQKHGAALPTLWQSLKLKRDHLLKNNTHQLFNQFAENEDTFWGKLMPQRFSWFKVPSELTAARFAMEVNAPQLYERLGQVLPFGCHAWEKYDSSFWSRFIPLNSNVVEQPA